MPASNMIYTCVLVCCFLGYLASAAALKEANNEENFLSQLRELGQMNVQPNVAEKRYSEASYTSLRSTQADKAAFRKFLRLLVGKRSVPTMDSSPIQQRSTIAANDVGGDEDMKGWVILAGRLNDNLIENVLMQDNDLMEI